MQHLALEEQRVVDGPEQLERAAHRVGVHGHERQEGMLKRRGVHLVDARVNEVSDHADGVAPQVASFDFADDLAEVKHPRGAQDLVVWPAVKID